MPAAKSLGLLSQPCLSLASLRQLHGRLLASGRLSDPLAAGRLLTSLLPLSLPLSRRLLLHLPLPSPLPPFLPNSLLRAHLPSSPLRTLLLFRRLRPLFLPNNYTLSFLLSAALPFPSPRLLLAAALHAHALALGWEPFHYVSNGLIHLYASHGLVGPARRLFDSCIRRDVVTWTSMLSGYAKVGMVDAAREVFDGMPQRNSVSWSAMVSGYVGAGRFQEAVAVFEAMQRARVRPNHAGLVAVLTACGALGALEQGRWVHAFVGRSGAALDRVLGTALVDMYAKCGCMETAAQVFCAMPDQDVFAYTSMISGLSNHGRCGEAIALFGQMRVEGVRPNAVTFICVLSACGRAGLVEQGRAIFTSMTMVYGIEPGVEHYGSLVDLLGRAGLLREALDVVRHMPMRPDSYVLGALLNACTVHGDASLGRQVVEFLAELGLDHSGVHVQLSNMYASSSKWERVVEVRKTMEEKNVVKVPGCSMVEADGVACEFSAGDRSHPQMEQIMAAAREMDKQLRSFGHGHHLEDVVRLVDCYG